jgi:3-oxoacyl-[acyl-carrier-protein] synthase-3
VFKHAVVKLAETGAAALDRAGLNTRDVDWLVPHQANLRIMTMTAHKLGLPIERVVITVADHGNTSAASIPLALSVARGSGRIAEGDLLLMEAIGGGLAWGAAVMRW